MRFVSHNPFTQQTIRSERVTVGSDASCAFCGSLRYEKRRKNPLKRDYLLRFHVEGYSARTSYPIERLFCSRSCAEAFHGTTF